MPCRMSLALCPWLILNVVLVASVLNAGLVAAEPEPAELLEQLARADRAGDEDAVERIASDWIRRDGAAADAFYWRGRSRFRRGQIAESVQDFDKHVALAPRREPGQWERGIALYYAGEFARGAKQFELYQTFDNRDVENSVWRYLCLARSEGVEKARATMLPIEGDRRIPMMTVYDLYRGKATPEELLQAARAGDPGPDVLAGRLFHAKLYLGLYYEAQGQMELAREQLLAAAEPSLRTKPGVNPYMWSVAHVHAQRWKKADRTTTPEKPRKP